MRKWLFSEKCWNCDFSTFWNFHFFHFSDSSVCFSKNFQQLGMKLVWNIYLQPILHSPGNNSILTKWSLYLWNATYNTPPPPPSENFSEWSTLKIIDQLLKIFCTLCDLFSHHSLQQLPRLMPVHSSILDTREIGCTHIFNISGNQGERKIILLNSSRYGRL